MTARTYKDAGVDIEGGEQFARFVAGIKSDAVSRSIGGFAGGFKINVGAYRSPVILSTTDGVGTKLLIAKALRVYDTVGIDLVAMCVNDLIASGARPKTFLDYIACGALRQTVLQDVIRGIVTGCEQSKCTLAGGETAELPDMYAPEDMDLAGFAVGVVEEDEMLPRKGAIRTGDAIIGLPSAGIHSNGFSLARSVVRSTDTSLMEDLLTPTRIYVHDAEFVIAAGGVQGIAHITGGGLEGNIRRVLPSTCRPVLRYDWAVPEIFKEIQHRGKIKTVEMRRVFNMGIGMAFVVSSTAADSILALRDQLEYPPIVIGEVATESSA